MIVKDYSDTGTKKRRGRGRAKKALNMIVKMRDIAEQMQPITGRGIGYRLFIEKLIEAMSKADMRTVYRLLLAIREDGTIPWDWIVDETRELEKVATWRDPKHFIDQMGNSYRRDAWADQPVRVIVASEKGTVRGVIRPITDEFGVPFLAVHGFTSGTNAHDLAEFTGDCRPLIILYVGDWDPSGMFMSEVDLPKRMAKYGGHHVTIRRISIVKDDLAVLGDQLSFPATDKIKDTRYKWFTDRYGDKCWELDAQDPRILRERVKAAIEEQILNKDAWLRSVISQKAQEESMWAHFQSWPGLLDVPPAPSIIIPGKPEASPPEIIKP